MNSISKEIIEKAGVVRPLTEINERECVAELAMAVPAGDSILEVGCLYGGMTAVLALAAPEATVTAMDNFSWHPEDDVPSSAVLLRSNMDKVGANNVRIIEGDSCVLGRTWCDPIALLWIDGGHTYDIAFLDLIQFGVWADVIAVHDYTNPFLEKQIQQAVSDFVRLMDDDFYLDKVVGTVAVIRRRSFR
jgi:hypothetical protein